MNEKALQTLEFYKILERLENHANSLPGKRLCRELRPSSSVPEITERQQETSDAVSRLLRKGNPSFGGTVDISGSLKRLQVGSSLNAAELLQIARLLENTSRIKSYGRRDRSEESSDCLDSFFDSLEPLTPLSTEIRRCILSESEIADDASSELRRIRRSIQISSDRIHSQLNALLNGPQRTALQDTVITMRNGRYCVPVKADARSSIPGMIHDQSSTGATLFIEPMSVVKLNNDIRELQLQEAAEIEAILAALSASAAGNSVLLENDLHVLTELDCIFARGKLALSMNATRPLFNTEGRLRLRQARHPLIDAGTVVPIDVSLGDTFDLLIITGPNTGGKTVSLKTTGLLSLMGQTGLHIPCLDRSELPVFTEIYADIGDEQSIEQSLSTFSAHMTNIVSFLEKADRQSLVLFDELGAGTDPTEGAALAISILAYLHRQGIRTMATTHYSELKIYALTTEGVENASCEFNVETLRPTYRLLIGIPGKSNAFAISARLGVPDHIIEDARSRIDSQDASFEDVLSRLEEERILLEQKQARFEKDLQEYTRREKQLSDSEKILENRKKEILEKADEEARQVLQEAKDYADRTLKDFRKFGKEHIDLSEMERQRTALREHLAQHSRPLEPDRKAKGVRVPKSSKLHPGDSVRVLSMNLNGIVRSEPDAKGNVFVQMGILRSKVSVNDLILLDEPVVTSEKLQKTGSGKIKMSKSMTVRPEINVIGKTVDEAIAEVDKYLDDAYLAHLETVRIVHGKGTGALRKGIHSYLRRQRHVDSFRLAEYGEGDAGVTIVKFK